MLRRALIVLSLCSTLLCVIVGFLSAQAMKESEQVQAEVREFVCADLVEKPPAESVTVQLDQFFRGKRLATIDNDGDQNWERLAIPLFPAAPQTHQYAYRAVILCAQGLPDEVSLDEALDSGELKVQYWPGRQQLERNMHSQLAQAYRNLDLEKSPIVFLGYGQENPVLGAGSYKLAWTVGGASVLMMLLAFVWGPLSKLIQPRQRPEPVAPLAPRKNMAGLPPLKSGR